METKKYTNEQEEYWSKRYEDESTGWDLGEVSTPLRHYIDQIDDKNSRILVPGAGNAYEAEYLFQSGFGNTHIVDISKLPLANFKSRVPDFPNEQILHHDFFELSGEFDMIVEQTFYCSFPPVDNIRERYTQKMHDLLAPEGKLIGLWFNIPFSGDFTKRPFGSTKSEYEQLFGAHFDFQIFEEAYNSMPGRAGQELFGVLKKRG